ncbi:MAG: hypothetical protein ABIG63_19265 [Chloroflexota bacterium]
MTTFLIFNGKTIRGCDFGIDGETPHYFLGFPSILPHSIPPYIGVTPAIPKEPDLFIIDFDTMIIKPNSGITDEQEHAVKDTILILKLNMDEDLVQERKEYFDLYHNGDISLVYLQQKASFIAYELSR